MLASPSFPASASNITIKDLQQEWGREKNVGGKKKSKKHEIWNVNCNLTVNRSWETRHQQRWVRSEHLPTQYTLGKLENKQNVQSRLHSWASETYGLWIMGVIYLLLNTYSIWVWRILCFLFTGEGGVPHFTDSKTRREELHARTVASA